MIFSCAKKVSASGVEVPESATAILSYRFSLPDPIRRKEDAEDRSVMVGVGAAAQANESAMLLDDALRDPQAEARSFFGFGGKKRFEEPALVLDFDALASISDYDANAGLSRIRPFAGFVSTDSQRAILGQSLYRIRQQV